MKISVVTTLYYSEPYIKEFYQRAKAALDELCLDHEFIIVNDGSPDGSQDVVMELMEGSSDIVLVELSRNYGHHKAAMEGIRQASGDLVFYSDCDLEESPELVKEFYEEWNKTKEYDLIYGVQESRKGGVFRRLGGAIFYKIVDFLSAASIPHNVSMTRLMTRRFVDDLVLYDERNFYIDGIFSLTGYSQKAKSVPKHYKGDTTYNLTRKIHLAIEGLLSQSDRLLLAVFVMGMTISLISALYVLYLIYQRIVNFITIDGWTGLMVSVWFLGGVTILSIGIVGLYVGKIFIETKKRPHVVVKNKIQKSK
jgi:putative glycosyltransferase